MLSPTRASPTGVTPAHRATFFVCWRQILTLPLNLSVLKKIRAYFRIVVTILILAYQLSRLVILTRIFGPDEVRGFKYRRKFVRQAIRALGIELQVEGTVPTETTLMVSNHRSMLDPLILSSPINAYIVSKAEVAKYPLIGRGADETGIIYVKREAVSSREAAKNAIRDGLKSGKTIMIYPEGTTSNQETTIDFRMGSFKVAAEEGIPVTPIALDYKNADDYWFHSPLLAHMVKVLGQKKIHAKIIIGEPIKSDDARFLMRTSREWVNEQILRMRKEWSED